MNLITKTGTALDEKKKLRSFGLFECQVCGAKVFKRLDQGQTCKSCGCVKKPDLRGTKFGRLTVKGKISGGQNSKWLCECECGKITVVLRTNLKNKNTLSCGCFAEERHREKVVTHGLSNHRIYNVWRSMVNRCSNPKNIGFDNYGGRGITVCERWKKFENFIEDMGLPEEGLDIDRINNGKGYFKENCRWVTRKQNARNTRKTVKVKWEGKEIALISLAEKYNIKYKCLYKRVHSLGWELSRALNQQNRQEMDDRQ